MQLRLSFILMLFWSHASFAGDEIAKSPVVLAFGDSLTAGYGLGPKEGFTPQLEAWLTDELGRPVTVINAGVSGDTSTGAHARLEWTVAGLPDGKADIVILELGGNDVLRGISPDITANNIDGMVEFFQDKGMKVLIAGMRAPPSYGPEYQASFDGLYPAIAEKYKAGHYPFFLEGVAMDKSLNQADGIHPTKEGIAIIVGNIGPLVASYLRN
jgi:acyl-CoA thioesterase I